MNPFKLPTYSSAQFVLFFLSNFLFAITLFCPHLIISCHLFALLNCVIASNLHTESLHRAQQSTWLIFPVLFVNISHEFFLYIYRLPNVIVINSTLLNISWFTWDLPSFIATLFLCCCCFIFRILRLFSRPPLKRVRVIDKTIHEKQTCAYFAWFIC